MDENLNAALELDDVHEVNEEPREPCGESGDVDAKDVGDGSGATDDGHVAFVEVMEGREIWFAGETGENDFCGVAALLDGGLSDAGEGLALVVEDVGKIADDEDVRKIGNGEIGKDLDFAGAIGFGASALGEAAREFGGIDAASPENGLSVQSAGGVAVFETDATGIDAGDEGVLCGPRRRGA